MPTLGRSPVFFSLSPREDRNNDRDIYIPYDNMSLGWVANSANMTLLYSLGTLPARLPFTSTYPVTMLSLWANYTILQSLSCISL